MVTLVAGCGLGGVMSDLAAVDDVEVPISRAGLGVSSPWKRELPFQQQIELTVLDCGQGEFALVFVPRADEADDFGWRGGCGG